MNPITRTLHRWSRTREERREAQRLARLPERLLRDMGLSLEGLAAISAQIRG
jgi:uncharacterized protein YjiS (DUF1127 family)